MFLGGRILGIFRPFSVTNERPEISALFPGKRADFSFSAWAVGGGRRADFTEGPHVLFDEPPTQGSSKCKIHKESLLPLSITATILKAAVSPGPSITIQFCVQRHEQTYFKYSNKMYIFALNVNFCVAIFGAFESSILN